MNLLGRPQSEEEQDREHKSKLVRSLRDKDYSEKEILDLTDADGVDLDEETAKEILGYEGVGMETTKRTFGRLYDPIKNTLKVIPKALYLPFSQIKDSDEKRKRNEEISYDTFGNVVAIFGNIVTLVTAAGFIFDGSYNNLTAYLTAHLGIVAGNGLYTLYKHEKGKKLKENRSRLERIAKSDDSGESFE